MQRAPSFKLHLFLSSYLLCIRLPYTQILPYKWRKHSNVTKYHHH